MRPWGHELRFSDLLLPLHWFHAHTVAATTRAFGIHFRIVEQQKFSFYYSRHLPVEDKVEKTWSMGGHGNCKFLVDVLSATVLAMTTRRLKMTEEGDGLQFKIRVESLPPLSSVVYIHRIKIINSFFFFFDFLVWLLYEKGKLNHPEKT